MVDFSHLANTKASDVEKPKPEPVGHYIGQFVGMMKPHESSQKKTPAFRFPWKIVGVTDDVDPEALEAFGGLAKASEKERTVDFWMTPDSQWRFTTFAEGRGHSLDMNLLELAEAVASDGQQFIIECKHEQSSDGKDTFARFSDPTNIEG